MMEARRAVRLKGVNLGFRVLVELIRDKSRQDPALDNESSLAGLLVNTQGWPQGTPVLCARRAPYNMSM